MKSPWWRRLLWTGFVLTLLGLVSLVILWWKLPAALTYAANYWLQKNGFEDSEVAFKEAGLKGVVIDHANVSAPGWSLQLGESVIDYDLVQLWNHKQVEFVKLSGLKVELNQDALTRESNPESSFRLDPQWFGYFPSKGMEIPPSQFKVVSQLGTFELTGSGNFSPVEKDAIGVDISITFNQLTTKLTGVLKPDFPLEFTLQTETPDLLELLGSTLPDWRTRFQIPPEMELMVGEAKADIQVSMVSLESIGTVGTLDFGPIQAEADNRGMGFESLQIHFKTTGAEQVSGVIKGQLTHAQVKAFALVPQSFSLNVLSEDLKHWLVSTDHPLNWEYDTDVVVGASTFSAAIGLNEALLLTGKVNTQRLSLSGLEVDPSTADIEFQKETLKYDLGDLTLTEFPSVRLTGGTGTVILNMDDTIDVSFQSGLAPEALGSLLTDSRLTPLTINLAATITDYLLSLKLDLDSPPAGELFEYADLIKMTGLLKTHIEATRPLDGLNWTGSLSSEISGLKVEGDGWHADEGSLATTLNFEALNQRIYLEENQTLYDHLMKTLKGNVVATANQLFAGPVTAQWMYSQLEFGSEDKLSPLKTHLTATAGSLKVKGDSVDQVSVEITSVGDLARQNSNGTVGFLYQGTEGNISISQAASALLENPSVTGKYVLNPMQFDYSDAIARHVPSLKDLSFSGKISAGGDYMHDETGTDATATINFENGSVELPSSKLTATGIDAAVSMASITQLRGEPKKSSVTINQIHVGDLDLLETEVSFDLLNPNKLSLNGAHTNIFGGKIKILPTLLALNPMGFSTVVNFDHISLQAITQQISIFNGTMDGFVNGQIPLVFKKGRFQAGEGRLSLSEGEKAHLQYNSSGLFGKTGVAGTGIKETIADRLMNKLQLEPGMVVENVLGNLTINELSIDLLPHQTPLTPIRIRISGEGKSGETKIPLNLETNVNGTLTELVDFLIQINSLGSPVLQ